MYYAEFNGYMHRRCHVTQVKAPNMLRAQYTENMAMLFSNNR